MAELADAADSKSAGLRPLGVRLPLPAPADWTTAVSKQEHFFLWFLFLWFLSCFS